MNPEVSSGRRRAILALLASTVLVVVMDLTIINVALNPIQQSLDATNGELQWALDSYLITFAAFLFTGGVCADRFGRKKTLITGLVLFGVSSVLGAFATDIVQLIIWRAVMGVGAAVVPTVTLAILMNVFPPAERPKAIAGWAAAAGVAMAVGPVLGGVLLEYFWWGSIFLINAPLIVIAVALMIALVPESKNPVRTAFDPLGVLLSIVSVGLLVYGIVLAGEDGWTSTGALGAIAGGVVLLVALVLFEKKIAAPSLDVSLLKNSRFAAGTGAIALCFFALISSIFISQFYFQAVLGFSPLEAGLLVLPMGIGSMVVSARCPKLVMKFGPRAVVAAGSTAIALYAVGAAFFDAGTPTWLLVVAQLLLGIGWGSIMAPATASLMSVVPPVKAGAGQAVSQTARQVAGALGIAIIGSLLSSGYRSSIGDAVNVLPEALRDEAAGSIGGTVRAVQAAKLGDQAPALLAKASDAYVSGMQSTLFVVAGVALVSVLVALRWLPKTPPAPPGPPPGAAAPGATAPGATAPGATAPGAPAAPPAPVKDEPSLRP
ncbi:MULTISPECIES: MFS transporter [unclassified Streptomyces]|uniref:MFS transporter n=1 Tax=unclassified Streptomyces TaxID=2593676 RepID=UPI0022510282|nr:MFS transporter [Streptomyces sp. NBC_00047]MCX5612886.1 MFS transporter [Streptomyces sp. NBC_00047]